MRTVEWIVLIAMGDSGVGASAAALNGFSTDETGQLPEINYLFWSLLAMLSG
ncbi:hypothetical protein [Aureliella helgolandensis]|uniref:hypothetical protein n=1 Tax=Aureliella helgolandensis TaxID=2527968 RepID=UPI0018D071A8|nr:hypothetical protein [Aureliella helgolandensis]